MEPFVARALINRLLNVTEKFDLAKFELTLPEGRYLTASEICQRYTLKPESVDESDIEKMTTLLWKWQRAWEVKYDELKAKHGDGKFNVNGDHLLGDLWAWEKFAEENYEQTQMAAPLLAVIPLLVLLARYA